MRFWGSALGVSRSDPPPHPKAQDPSGEAARREFVQAVDDALPTDMLAFLEGAFRRDGPFWKEHNYHSEETSYFSYLHPLLDRPQSAREPPLPLPRTLIFSFP